MLLTILGVSLLIVLHEYGHYGVARAFNMRVLRFSVGFGPVLFQRKRGETTWQIAAFPFGGFVQVDGMGMRDDDVVDDERNYRNKPTWQRSLVVLAGPAVNWLLAAAFVASLGMTAGIASPDGSATVGVISPESPAASAGFEAGDQVIAADDAPIGDWNELVAAIQKAPEQEVRFTVMRDSKTIELIATPKLGESGVGLLGVGPQMTRTRYGVLGSMAAGASYAWQSSVGLVELLYGMVAGTREGQLSGLPGIVKMVSTQAKAGLDRFVQTLAYLSVTLFVLNMFPFPALDGGRLVFLTAEAIRGRPAPEKVEAYVHGIGMIILLGLVLVLSVRDLL